VNLLKDNRVWEIDFIRFLAIVMMVTFHFVYDLNEFVGVNVSYEAGVWHFVGAASAILFIFISGISSGFSRNTFKRGLKVLGFGMILTVATYFFDKEQYIRFGILHFLGVSMMLFPLLKKINNWLLLIVGIVSFVLGRVVEGMVLKTVLLLPLGFMYSGFASLDYYPLFPYIAYFILGILCYKLYYHKRKSLFKFEINSPVIDTIAGNSLLIYLVHQPVFLAGIYLLGFVK
jgi:uncharacterized membrane protein